MLGILTKSAIRRKIILLFVYNQRKEFYLSEIARRVKTTPGTAQRELNRLLAMDLIAFQKRGNLNLYKLNGHYTLLREIEAIVRKTYGAEVELNKELSKFKGISFAFLFGSYAKGSMKSDSDIDLFIVGDPAEDDVYRAVRKVEDLVGKEINYHIAGEAEFAQKSKTRSFMKDIVAKPLMLLGKEDELRQRLG
jgi:predicted nucleotidyltransferase